MHQSMRYFKAAEMGIYVAHLKMYVQDLRGRF